MARGWESKSVEEQQTAARDTQAPAGVRLTPEQQARTQRRKGLELSRQRIRTQLESVTNPVYRKMLQDSLSQLDSEIAALS